MKAYLLMVTTVKLVLGHSRNHSVLFNFRESVSGSNPHLPAEVLMEYLTCKYSAELRSTWSFRSFLLQPSTNIVCIWHCKPLCLYFDPLPCRAPLKTTGWQCIWICQLGSLWRSELIYSTASTFLNVLIIPWFINFYLHLQMVTASLIPSSELAMTSFQTAGDHHDARSIHKPFLLFWVLSFFSSALW